MPPYTDAYHQAEKMARSHYENFPVLSLAVPKALQKDIAIIYWFARTADDIADEGILENTLRIQKLNDLRIQFVDCIAGSYASPAFKALHETIIKHNLTPELFLELLSAFEQDITVKKYTSLEELFDYCCRSANPIGRLLLKLYKVKSVQAEIASDSICTGLQLTNFWQDVSVDIEKGRIYIPVEFLHKHGIAEHDIQTRRNNVAVQKCIEELVQYTDAMLFSGMDLIPLLPGAFQWQIMWTILGGRKILAKIKKNKYNVLRKRVKLSIVNIFQIAIQSVFHVRNIRKRNSKEKQ